MSHGFPNHFFLGIYQGGVSATVTETFNQQAFHIAFIIAEAMRRDAVRVEVSQKAQDMWVNHIRETAVDVSELQRECTPSYFNNEGEKSVDEKGKEAYRWYLGEVYGPGWEKFKLILQEWREKKDLEGLVLKRAG